MGQNITPGAGLGLDLTDFVSKTTTQLGTQADALNSQMTALANGTEVSQEQLTALQYQMGQYNAKIEALSAMTKSIQDMLKSLAQRTG